MEPMVDGPVESLDESAPRGSGVATIYLALDHVVARYGLRDAAVVVEVPELGRQVSRAGRRPLRRDEQRLRNAEPGLSFDPHVHDPAFAPLVLAVSALALRVDARSGDPGVGEGPP